MAKESIRINIDADPRRCHGTTPTGQCRNVAVDGSTLCESCSHRKDLVRANRHQYLLTDPRFQKRLAQISENDGLKSLRTEIDLIRMLIEERMNSIKGNCDLPNAISAVNALAITLEKLTSKSHILEQNLGQLFHKSTVVQLMQAYVQIVSDEVKDLPGGIEAKDRIIARIFETTQNVRNEEKARGMRLLSKDM